jgi:hypothetical protein
MSEALLTLAELADLLVSLGEAPDGEHPCDVPSGGWQVAASDVSALDRELPRTAKRRTRPARKTETAT